ncbi:MAG TPA: fused MFS/spermidine synthase [Polyangiales bacterium]|nr:fused MFS/spermidine synthase [Polyangiales bacterium]
MSRPLAAGAPNPWLVRGFYCVFTASGFAGLIYESVWSHYLKLVLGHAAYAQTFVLAIFMGGMALGAWAASRWTRGMRDPLRTYAWIEAILALCALVFHRSFESIAGWLQETLVPSLDSAAAILVCKWSVCAALIGPACVLLGMTFPLLSVGLMRLSPARSGATLSTLYFTNSLGAVAGALSSGFVLIPAIGLPGTVTLAGMINAAAAVCVLWLARVQRSRSTVQPAPSNTNAAPAHLTTWFLTAALLTGFASFCYEIAWVRMLSLVLGTTVQAFELMLSAFIAGLAFGSLYIRRRIDRLTDPARVSGYVQVLMGMLALSTLVLYNFTFDWMSRLLLLLPRDHDGYVLFNLGSAALALAVMLPTTFVAGTTLPLFTHVLVQRGSGEASVGRVYSANTCGAIAGVLLSVHLVMPWLGVKGVVALGALVDVGLGFALLAMRAARSERWRVVGLFAAVSCVFAGVLIGARLDPARMAGGVYRTRQAEISAQDEVVYHRDGKTATIDVIRSHVGVVAIKTNGKPDASAAFDAKFSQADELTMVALGAFSLAHVPHARRVANIGFGSGMTTHVLLGATPLEVVDTIEIEPAMVEGARAFGRFSERAYDDPRSRVHIEDAKTFLSGQRAQYDIVVSEPSNPWVSGVASLFSREFYRDVKRHIKPGGVLVQWSQLYETDLDNIASVFKALGEHFEDYVVYCTNDIDVMIVASADRKLSAPHPWIFSEPALAAELARVGIARLEDLAARRIGDRRSLEALFSTSSVPANSDFFPYLSYRAPLTRFLGSRLGLATMLRAPVAVPEILDQRPRAATQPWTESPHFIASGMQRLAFWAHAVLTDTPPPTPLPRVPQQLAAAVDALRRKDCEVAAKTEPQLHAALQQVATLTTSLLPASKASEIWQHLRAELCLERHSAGFRAWFELYAANAARDSAGMHRAAALVLQLTDASLPREYLELALTAGTLGALQAQGAPAAVAFFAQQHRGYTFDERSPLELLLVASTAAHRAGKL